MERVISVVCMLRVLSQTLDYTVCKRIMVLGLWLVDIVNNITALGDQLDCYVTHGYFVLRPCMAGMIHVGR